MGVGTMIPLPPDLSRLGDELTAAAGRALVERRRRRRLAARTCASAMSAVLAIAVLAPSTLSPGLQLASPLAEEASGTLLLRLVVSKAMSRRSSSRVVDGSGMDSTQ